jgi:hypothetical protein
MPLAADALLAGPRGRRVCLEAVLACSGDTSDLRTALFWAGYWAADGSAVLYSASAGASEAARAGSREQISRAERETMPHPAPREVAELIDEVDLHRLDDRTVDAAVTASVTSARYWQEPDGEDGLAATNEVRNALVRVARRICELPGVQWWSSPMDPARQAAVAFDGVPQPADDVPRHDVLDGWRQRVEQDEVRAARERPADPTANWSGTWWTRPSLELRVTTRDHGATGPARLDWVEDGLGWTRAVATAVDVPANADVYEIDGPDAWIELCRRHLLEVTASRRHDWYRTTGRVGRWVIPDWSSIGREHDGVHLSVAGYLASAGRALPVDGDTATVLAGWDPDATYWFTPVRLDASTTKEWTQDDDGAWRS